MKEILNILGFEYMGYARSKAFRITTVVFVVIILIASMIPQIKGIIDSFDSKDEKSEAAIIIKSTNSSEVSWIDFVNTEALNEVTVTYNWTVEDASADPTALINDGTYTAVILYSGGSEYTLYGSGYDFSLYELIALLDEYFSDVNKQAILAEMTEVEKSAVNEVLAANVAGEITSVSSDGSGGADAMQNFWLSYVMLYVLFMVVMMYGQFVVNSVVLEKSTKAMELLITSAKPTRLMYGKVFGVGLAALTQLMIIMVAVFVGMLFNFSKWKSEMPEISEMLTGVNLSPSYVIFFILFFVTGYFLYAFIYAALGSTVSRMEDAGSIVTMPMLILVAAFVVSIIGMSNIDAAYVKILSYIPFFSPFIMFSRMSMGEAGVLEASIALIILFITIAILGWLAARIYRIGVMMYGKPMKLGSVIKLVAQK